jgi:hypothetical protein
MGQPAATAAPDPPCHGDVAEFMQRPADEDEQQENNRFNGAGRFSGAKIGNGDPGEEEQDGDKEPDLGACDPADGE